MAGKKGTKAKRWSQEDNEAFIRAWQNADSVADVVKETGLDITQVRARATALKGHATHPVPLKKMKAVSKVDYQALQRLAKQLA